MRAMLLQVLYSMPSKRQLAEPIQHNLLLRWFVGLAVEDTVWKSTRREDGSDEDPRVAWAMC